MNGYKFEGIINGFTLDENLIDGNVICDIDKQILCVSKKTYKSSEYIDVGSFDINNLNYYEKFLIVLNSYLIRKPEYIIFKNMFCDFEYEDIKKHNYVLVDHNDPLQSVGIKAKIVGCIDHHSNCNKIKNAIITDYCSASLYMYKLFKDIYNFSKKQKFQIYMAFLNDSTFGKSSRYKKKDAELALELGFDMNFEKLFKEYFKPTNLNNGVENAIYNGHKQYQFGNATFESGYIEAFGIKDLEKYKEIIKNKQNFLGIWIDYCTSKTYVFFNYKSKFNEWEYNFVASRATTIINDTLNIVNQK